MARSLIAPTTTRPWLAIWNDALTGALTLATDDGVPANGIVAASSPVELPKGALAGAEAVTFGWVSTADIAVGTTSVQLLLATPDYGAGVGSAPPTVIASTLITITGPAVVRYMLPANTSVALASRVFFPTTVSLQGLPTHSERHRWFLCINAMAANLNLALAWMRTHTGPGLSGSRVLVS
jgi:hypothetical protein